MLLCVKLAPTLVLLAWIGLLTCNVQGKVDTRNPPAADDGGLTLSHTYKIDIPNGALCQVDLNSAPGHVGGLSALPSPQPSSHEQMVSTHHIRLRPPCCDCEGLVEVQSLHDRLDKMEELLASLREQYSRDCCGNGRRGTPDSAVLAPKLLRLIRAEERSLLVSWDHVSGVDYYILRYHPINREADSQQLKVINTQNQHQILGLLPSNKYQVSVYTVRKDVHSDSTNLWASTVSPVLEDIRVLLLTESAIEVEWRNPQAEVDHYLLKYSALSGMQREALIERSVGPKTKHRLTGLHPGTAYRIAVSAVSDGIEGKTTSVIATTALDRPRKLIIDSVTENTATVSWDQCLSPVDGYMLRYSSGSGANGETSVPAGRSSVTLRGLEPGTKYTLSIWAVKGASQSQRASADITTDIDPPTELTITGVTHSSAAITWKAPVAVIGGYILTYHREGGASKDVRLRPAQLSWVLQDLGRGARYQVRVIAFNEEKRSTTAEVAFSTVGVPFLYPMDCGQLLKNGDWIDGVYTIYLNNNRFRPLDVFCDMSTDGGGWIVFQRRRDGGTDFFQRWKAYVHGFGDLKADFWLGLENLGMIVSQGQYELRVDLGTGTDTAYALYQNFTLAGARNKFKLTVGKYSGTAGDALTYHNNHPFTTRDQDNDVALSNCAVSHRGGWWYKNCHLANLNGRYGDNRHSTGINWDPWKGLEFSLQFVEMKIRSRVSGIVTRRKRLTDRHRTSP